MKERHRVTHERRLTAAASDGRELVGNTSRLALAKFWIIRPLCFRLFWQDIRRAASRADCTAGRSSPTSVPMMAITTNSSTRVKPCRLAAERRDENERIDIATSSKDSE